MNVFSYAANYGADAPNRVIERTKRERRARSRRCAEAGGRPHPTDLHIRQAMEQLLPLAAKVRAALAAPKP